MFRESEEYISVTGSEASAISVSAGVRSAFGLQRLRANDDQQLGNRSQVACYQGNSLCLPEKTWKFLEAGLRQRFEALAAFLQQLCTEQRLPQFLQQLNSVALESVCRQWVLPLGDLKAQNIPWTWFGATDLVLEADGSVMVMDQDFSHPSGLERLVHQNWKSTDDAVECIRGALFSGSVGGPVTKAAGSRQVVVLDPGFSGATFRGNEFLARCLSAQMSRSADLIVERGEIFVRVSGERRPVGTLIRRIDDELLDPNCFRPDSLVGLPGLVRSWKAGQVSVLNPPGSGLARLRCIGRLVPLMIREYLGQAPLLESAEVYECSDAQKLQRVLANPQHFAFRTDDPLHPARPYVGSMADAVEYERVVSRIVRSPASWIARPLLIPNSGRRSLRLFGTLQGSFGFLRAGLARNCQEDGGASLLISPSESISTIW